MEGPLAPAVSNFDKTKTILFDANWISFVGPEETGTEEETLRVEPLGM